MKWWPSLPVVSPEEYLYFCKGVSIRRLWKFPRSKFLSTPPTSSQELPSTCYGKVNESRKEEIEWMSVWNIVAAEVTFQIIRLVKSVNMMLCCFLRWIFWKGRSTWHQICPLSLRTEFVCYSSFPKTWDSIFHQGRWGQSESWPFTYPFLCLEIMEVAKGKRVRGHRGNSQPSCRGRQAWKL